MSKQQHSVNSVMLHHLPGIYNTMYIVNMMVFGLVVSQPVFFLMGISSLQKSVRVSANKLVKKNHRRILSNVKILIYLSFAIIISLLLLQDNQAGMALPVTAIIVLLAAADKLLTIWKNHYPASQIAHHLKSTSPCHF